MNPHRIASVTRHGRAALLGKSGGIGGFVTYVVPSSNRGFGIFEAVSRVSVPVFGGLRRGVRTLAAELSAGP